MYRADRSRSKVITSNKAGKAEAPRHDETGPTSPVFCFARPETIRRVGQKLVKNELKVTTTAGTRWPERPPGKRYRPSNSRTRGMPLALD
jgi:hypothetical protein